MRLLLPIALVFWVIVSVVAPRLFVIVLVAAVCTAVAVASKELIETARNRPHPQEDPSDD